MPFFNNFADELFNPSSVINSSYSFTYLDLILPIFIQGIFPFSQYSFLDLEGVPPDTTEHDSPIDVYSIISTNPNLAL